MKKEKACGCIIIEDNKVLLVYEKNTNFWGFPKGHIEEGETELETALREVKEEVGLDVTIDESRRYVLNYIIRDEIDKTTVLFLAKVKGGELIKQEEEIEEVRWCSFDEAIELLTYNNLKDMFKKVMEDLK